MPALNKVVRLLSDATNANDKDHKNVLLHVH